MKRPQLTEPVEIEKFWANRRKDAIITTLSTFKETNLVDIRKYVMSREGRLVPTPKGISVKVTRLPDLLKAVTKAVEKAKALGLIDGEGAADDSDD